MDTNILLLIVFVVLWAAVYLYLHTRLTSTDWFLNYRQWIENSLADMFVNLSAKRISRAVIFITIIGSLLGFLIPGGISQLDNKLSIERAIKSNRQGEYAQTVLHLEAIKAMDSPLVHNELGVAYMGLKNYSLAEQELKEAVRLLPYYEKAHQNLAELYIIMDRFAEAFFAEVRAQESASFTISEEKLYNLSGTLTDQLGARLFLAALLALGAYMTPRAVIAVLRWRRRKKIDEQLADGLTMIANGLRAGLSLVQAIETVVREAKPPLSQEFEIVLREHRLGSSLGDALIHLAQRIPGKDTRIMVNATLILLESGGNLPERFDNLANTIHERKRVQQKIKTMTAEGETQAWILAALPLVLALVLNYMNHDVFQLMYTTPLGWLLMILIVLMESVGLYLMLKMVKVKI